MPIGQIEPHKTPRPAIFLSKTQTSPFYEFTQISEETWAFTPPLVP